MRADRGFSPVSQRRKVSNENDEKVVKEPHAPVPTRSVSWLPASEKVTSASTKLPTALTTKVERGNSLMLTTLETEYRAAAPIAPPMPTSKAVWTELIDHTSLFSGLVRVRDTPQ